MERSDNTKIIDLLKGAESIAIVPSKVAGKDAFAAGVGLFHALKAQYSDSDISLIYPGELPEDSTGLIDEENIVSEIDERELVLALDYSETPAAKIKYDNSTAGLLYLHLTPVNKKFDVKKNVRVGMKGFDFDVVITIGAQVLRDLGRTYSELQLEFFKAKIINIDTTDMNHRFGAVNVVDPSMDSLSLLVLNSLPTWDLNVTTKAAKALLEGVSHNTLS